MTGQLAFDLDALDVNRFREYYSCGRHELHRQVDAHWIECRKLVCARCGEVSPTSFLAELNHNHQEWQKFCCKQGMLLNHAARCRMILNGKWPHDPPTNCYAKGHDHSDRTALAYFSAGCPTECVQAEYDEKAAWLSAHGVEPDLIGSLGTFNALRGGAA